MDAMCDSWEVHSVLGFGPYPTTRIPKSLVSTGGVTPPDPSADAAGVRRNLFKKTIYTFCDFENISSLSEIENQNSMTFLGNVQATIIIMSDRQWVIGLVV
jgi:hypothetical protein